MNRKIRSLNGIWQRSVAGGAWETQKVPFCSIPVGFSVCKTTFSAQKPRKNAKVFLVFDGITYGATVTLNGHTLGDMLAYCEYRFDVTDLVTERENELCVTVRDLGVPFGPAEGWENYSGIIRDVYLLYTAPVYIENVYWHVALCEKSAAATVEITVGGADASLAEVTLFDGEKTVAKASATLKNGRGTAKITVKQPKLWSPDTPHLYLLKTTLFAGGKPCDSVETRVGIKDFAAKGKRFYVNGAPLFLLGVCRHDVWGNEGHVMTRAQMRKDLEMIKATGANYVRLVHYPHHKYILELADEIGLFVSEEPGLWWSDMQNPAIVAGSLEVLRRTVLRDRNHVSMAFWLSFNECIFTPEYLRAALEVCRKADPYRMASGANCMSLEMTKEHFLACDMDFYTMHPYHATTERLQRSAEYLSEKPLLFTEWGGYYVSKDPERFARFADEMVKLWQNPDDEPVLAGATYWCWSDIYEFSRSAPACSGGVQHEGMVSIDRKPYPIYRIYRERFAAVKSGVRPPIPTVTPAAPLSLRADAAFLPVSLAAFAHTPQQHENWKKMMETASQPIECFFMKDRKNRRLICGPILKYRFAFEGLPTELRQKPLVLDENTEICVKPDVIAVAAHIIGCVSMPKGFPIGGEYGEEAARIEVTYDDGEKTVTPLRNGQEITTATAWYGPSRIDPRAANAPRILRYVIDPDGDREQYVINRYRLPLAGKKIASLAVRGVGEGYFTLLYGITLEM